MLDPEILSLVLTCNAYLIEGDKLSIQSHQVSNLWHFAQHEGDESGVTFALFASKGSLGKQHAGFNRVLDLKKKTKFDRLTHSEITLSLQKHQRESEILSRSGNAPEKTSRAQLLPLYN